MNYLKTYFFLIVGVLIFINIDSTAQDNQFKIDSLKNVLKTSKADTVKAEVLLLLADYYFMDKPDSAMSFCNKALEISLKNNYESGMSAAYGWMGYIYDQTGNDSLALIYHKKSYDVDFKRNDSTGMAICLTNIGYILKKKRNIKAALEYYHKAISIRNKNEQLDSYAANLNNIATIYKSEGDYKLAIKYFKESYRIIRTINFPNGEAYILSNLGVCFGDDAMKKKTKIDSAYYYHFKALEIREKIQDIKGLIESYNNLARLFIYEKKYKESQNYSKKSIVLSQKLGSKRHLSVAYNMLGESYSALGNYDSSKYCLERAYLLAKEVGYPFEMAGAAMQLRKYYERKKDYKNALFYFDIHVQMRDSIQNEDTKNATVKQYVQYEYDKQKAIDDKEHEKLFAIEKEEKEKQSLFTKAVGVTLFLVILALIFIVRSYLIKKNANIQLQEKNTEILHQKHLVEEKNHEILQSINYAKRLQQSILPPPRLVKEYMKDSFVLYMPKDIVAGDFYWIESHNNKIYFAAADCTGHGVPGAMVSMVCHNALNRALLEFNLLSPSLMLDKASELVDDTFSKSEDNVQDGMDVSLYCLDTTTLQLEWAGANNPLWMIQNGEFKEIKADKQPVGRYENRKPFTNHVLQLNEGDSLFSITDGYPDQFGGEQGKKYTYKKLREYLLKISNKPMSLQKDDLIAEFDRWKSGHDQVDDVCIIGVKV